MGWDLNDEGWPCTQSGEGHPRKTEQQKREKHVLRGNRKAH